MGPGARSFIPKLAVPPSRLLQVCLEVGVSLRHRRIADHSTPRLHRPAPDHALFPNCDELRRGRRGRGRRGGRGLFRVCDLERETFPLENETVAPGGPDKTLAPAARRAGYSGGQRAPGASSPLVRLLPAHSPTRGPRSWSTVKVAASVASQEDGRPRPSAARVRRMMMMLRRWAKGKRTSSRWNSRTRTILTSRQTGNRRLRWRWTTRPSLSLLTRRLWKR